MELTDLLGVLAILLQFSGVMAVSVRAYMLRQRQKRGCAIGPGWSGVLILLAAAWCGLGLFDINSALASLGNGVADIPPMTTLRIALFGLWLWVLQGILWRLAKDKLS